MKYAALGLLIFSSVALSSYLVSGQVQAASAQIAASDPDFSVVIFPDTQYYRGNYAYVFQDQANWVVSHAAFR